MALQAPEGAKDLLPDEAKYWEIFRNTAYSIFSRYGYVQIETPIFEQTELFVRGIGEATDVVSKEMFQAVSGENMNKLIAGEKIKPKSHLSLRPEGTAGVVRAVVQHDLVPQGAAPAKLMYAGPMFRAERPQKGRQRQFNQVGIECIGADAPTVDAEAIIMLIRFFEEIGIPRESMRLLVNSMGCDDCRPAYRELVKEFILEHKEDMCDECLRRAEINPLRAFDCKNESCAKVMDGAPKITEHLCDACSTHYKQVKGYLESSQLDYIEESRLVRGLDYYTRTVFEVQVIEGLGSQNAIGGGGRYDKLSEEVGGRPTPGLGFALGYERCVLALRATGFEFPVAQTCDIFIASVDDSVRSAAFNLARQCRDAGLVVDLDHQSRSLKSQFKLADKLSSKIVCILGPDELANSSVKLRNMDTREEKLLSFDELTKVLHASADSSQICVEALISQVFE
ncbi:MAG: histidine--tRNA ligase [Raoultibacter sp.]|jgi:histidyl-tRNA synthetase